MMIKNKLLYFYLITAFLLYIIGYFFAHPNVPRAFIYNYSLMDTIIDLIEKIFVFGVTSIILSLLYKNRIFRVLSIIGISLLTINFVLSIYFRIVFNKDFDTGLALSFFGTNSDEVLSFLREIKIYIYFFITIVYFVITLKFVQYLSEIKWNIKRYSILIFGIIFTIIYHFVGYHTVYYTKNINKFRNDKREFFSNIYPVYLLNEFIVAYKFSNDLEKIKSVRPNFTNIQNIPNEIENIIVIIGESARRKNMSLYGYSRDTTPNEDKEKNNMYLYTNAISPAPLTLISIPLILSEAMPDDYSYSSPKYANNILTLAHHLGYETYWITTQKFPGQDVSLLAVFENYAQNIIRIDGVYDEKIIPHFSKVIKNRKNKKLIVLHINGSHTTYCDKYPSTESYFSGMPNNIDCFDNSIRYTDKVIGKIFKILENTKSSLIYVSDHGTSMKNNSLTFSNTKDRAEVPMYIWHTPMLRKENIPFQPQIVPELTQTTILYPIVSILMGGGELDFKQDIYRKNLRFVLSDLSVVNYDELKDKE